eukprot:1009574-Rhodomonas_salina.4
MTETRRHQRLRRKQRGQRVHAWRRQDRGRPCPRPRRGCCAAMEAGPCSAVDENVRTLSVLRRRSMKGL